MDLLRVAFFALLRFKISMGYNNIVYVHSKAMMIIIVQSNAFDIKCAPAQYTDLSGSETFLSNSYNITPSKFSLYVTSATGALDPKY